MIQSKISIVFRSDLNNLNKNIKGSGFMEIGNKLHLENSYLSDLIINEFIYSRSSKGLNVHQRNSQLAIKSDEFDKLISEYYSSDVQIIQLNKEKYLLKYNDDFIISIRKMYREIDITGIGDDKLISDFFNYIESNFEVIKNTIKWVYGPYQDHVTIPFNEDNYPVVEMYPFIQKKYNSIEEYYEEYLNSNANILILAGPPGTGKTTFIKGLLLYSGMKSMISYDMKCIETDDFFAEFISSEETILILEDIDILLLSRIEGNPVAHKILNVGDGLVSSKKKIVFTTNLNVKDLDKATIRPGRCFDLLEFEYLNKEEAKKLANKIGVGLLEKSEELWTVAEIYNSKHNIKDTKHNFGFIGG